MYSLAQILALIFGLTLLPKAIAMLENGCLLDGMVNGVVASPCAVPYTVKDETSSSTAASTSGSGAFSVGCTAPTPSAPLETQRRKSWLIKLEHRPSSCWSLASYQMLGEVTKILPLSL